jgi:hypothetical protein
MWYNNSSIHNVGQAWYASMSQKQAKPGGVFVVSMASPDLVQIQ